MTATDAATPILVATAVRKSYRTGPDVVHAVEDVDLTVLQGEFVAITGRSGSGKTTLINCLSGLDDIDAGSVVLDGVDLAAMSDTERTDQRARVMGFVFQTSNLLPVYTAQENVALPMVLGGTSSKDTRERLRVLCWNGSGWGIGSRTTRASFQVANSSGSRSHARL